ncbi:hypothetical protein BU24DRAFT_423000 [Aaosphaeria arxii CBS 175.79]|uniref:MARVEL domain-containing protein n=1 Tax=Aaosphaeria arxii CBS 175.79 TaxID=1450172 RepID=A0A6A5XVG1_9PLEO|nr:uncharacterized protein BU24DRAFT_423000 [Aaosphaeria arxii CBS 175.79]KAF2016620.1 hypothetical protein BU24DRAFT_423000 [Aaosphaeria arxii CBS 175.79]
MAPSEVNFMVFTPVWSILSVIPLILIPLKMPHLATSTVPKIGLIALEALTMLYWFAGFIALAVFLSDRICFGTVCSVAKAGTALSAFSWVAWAVTLAMSALRAFRTGFKKGESGGEPKVEMHQGV